MAQKIPVTLVCATGDLATLEPVRERLHALGHPVELVAGVEAQPRLVGDALDRLGPHGVLVACTSRALDGPTLRKIEGVFGARRGPQQTFARVDLGPSAAQLVTTIQRACEAVAASSARVQRRPTREGSPLREVIPVSDRVAVPAPPPRAERTRNVERPPTDPPVSPAPPQAPLTEVNRFDRFDRFDRIMVAILVGAGLVAVLAALSFSGAL